MSMLSNDRLNDIAAEIRTTWERVARDIEATRVLLNEARDLCRQRGESFDKWVKARHLGFGKTQAYRILDGKSSGSVPRGDVEGVDAFFAARAVASACFATTRRVLAAEGIDLADLHWIEPCAGGGAFLRLMPEDRRVGYDLKPADDGEFGIEQGDYRDRQLDATLSWVGLTNAQFSKKGPQTCFNWLGSQDGVLAIAIITPHYFQDPPTVNRLNPFFHLVYHEVLDANTSFIRADGKPASADAIFQIWVRRDYERAQILVRKDHPDWTWLKKNQAYEADCCVQVWGVGCGEIKKSDNLGRANDPTHHDYIREIKPGTIDRLKALDWGKIGYPTTATPRIHKHQIVAAYSAKYDGAAAAPVYDHEVTDGDYDDDDTGAPLNMEHLHAEYDFEVRAACGSTRSKILDMSAGSRAIWFDKASHPDRLFIDHRATANADIICDSKCLPLADNQYDLIVFDPPHTANSPDQQGHWSPELYGLTEQTRFGS